MGEENYLYFCCDIWKWYLVVLGIFDYFERRNFYNFGKCVWMGYLVDLVFVYNLKRGNFMYIYVYIRVYMFDMII